MNCFYGGMAIHFSCLDYLYVSAFVVASLHFLLPSSCVDAWPVAAAAPPGLLLDDKTRLGSTPPSCNNRCNNCNPCTAVQVPTLPVRYRSSDPGLGSSIPSVASPQPLLGEKYTTYKPMGWKCRCRSRLFNP